MNAQRPSATSSAGGTDAANFVAVFTSRHEADTLPAALSERFPNAVVVGCSGSGVIGSGREEEEAPALSLTAGLNPS